MIYLGPSGEDSHEQPNKTCQECSGNLKNENSAAYFCSGCGAYYPKNRQNVSKELAVECGSILATALIDIVLLVASGLLAGAAIDGENIALGILAIPAIVGMLSYVIGGNKVTYRLLKALFEYALGTRKNERRFNWIPVRKALKGDGFMVGVALFVMFTLVISAIIIATQFGDLENESYFALAKMIIIPVILILIFPLIGIAAKLVGNEKAPAECGINSIKWTFFTKHTAANTSENNSASVEERGDNGAGGETGYSF